MSLPISKFVSTQSRLFSAARMTRSLFRVPRSNSPNFPNTSRARRSFVDFFRFPRELAGKESRPGLLVRARKREAKADGSYTIRLFVLNDKDDSRNNIPEGIVINIKLRRRAEIIIEATQVRFGAKSGRKATEEGVVMRKLSRNASNA